MTFLNKKVTCNFIKSVSQILSKKLIVNVLLSAAIIITGTMIVHFVLLDDGKVRRPQTTNIRENS